MTDLPECFLIMPIADPEGCEAGHFRRVCDDILKPACTMAGYKPVRADDVCETNLIQLDILKRLIESPMAVCDLSTTNPNVLFELGVRQAFDKPTVLVQEFGTRKIFDISILRYTEYCPKLKYHEVLKNQKAISEAIKKTAESTSNSEGVNSIVRLLSLTAAKLQEPSGNDSQFAFQMLMAEISEIKKEIRNPKQVSSREDPYRFELDSEFESVIDFQLFRIKQLIEKGNKERAIDVIQTVNLELNERVKSEPKDSHLQILAMRYYFELKRLQDLCR